MTLLTGLTEDDLEAQALAADPDPAVAPDARPFAATSSGLDLLPDWYMPSPVPGRATPGRRAVALVVVAAALVINGLGFCLTYGTLSAG